MQANLAYLEVCNSCNHDIATLSTLPVCPHGWVSARCRKSKAQLQCRHWRDALFEGMSLPISTIYVSTIELSVVCMANISGSCVDCGTHGWIVDMKLIANLAFGPCTNNIDPYVVICVSTHPTKAAYWCVATWTSSAEYPIHATSR